MKFTTLAIFSITLAALPVSAQTTTIFSSVSDISFSSEGGASVASNTGGVATFQTGKNSSVWTELPVAYDLANTGDQISVTFDMTLSSTSSNTASTIDIVFSDSSTVGTTGTRWDGSYEFTAQVDPFATGNGVTFRDGAANNLGRFDTDAVFGTSTHTLTLTVERTGADEISVSFVSPSISSTLRTRPATTPLPTNIVDTFGFAFRGNAWNETDNDIEATIANFSMTTNASAVPEPSLYALTLGAIAIGLGILRRRQ